MNWLIYVSQRSYQFLNDLTRVCGRDISSSHLDFLHKVVWKHSYLAVQFSLAPSIIHICYILDDVSNFQTELVVLLCDVVKSDASCPTQQMDLELADVEKFRQQLRMERCLPMTINVKAILTHGDKTATKPQKILISITE